MIVDALTSSERIERMNPYFKIVFEYLKTHDLTKMPVGRIDIAGENAYIKIEDAKGRRTSEAVFERHDKYIDIQMPLSGKERYGWKPKSLLREEQTPYDGGKDIVFYSDPIEVLFTLSPGEFVIFFPEDAHAPCIGEGMIRKAVVKVKNSD